MENTIKQQTSSGLCGIYIFSSASELERKTKTSGKRFDSNAVVTFQTPNRERYKQHSDSGLSIYFSLLPASSRGEGRKEIKF